MPGKHYSELVSRVSNERDRAAFAELFDYFGPRLKGYLQQQGASEGEAEEIVQDVMLTLWQRTELYDPERSSVSTWLYRIARNRRIDQLRRQMVREVDAEDPFFQPEPEEDVGVAMDSRLREERIRAAMQKLSPEQREVVRQAFFLGLSHSEIADHLGLPVGTVKSRLRLAFARLRRFLETDSAVDVEEFAHHDR